MNEPSVLNYLKSKLGMPLEEKGTENLTALEENALKSSISPAVEPVRQADGENNAFSSNLAEEKNDYISSTDENETPQTKINLPDFSVLVTQASSFPLRTLAALLLALIGQGVLARELSSTIPVLGIVFYLISFAMLGSAYRREEWILSPLPQEEAHKDSWQFRIIAFVFASIFAMLALFTFSKNSFNLLNVFPWVVSLTLFVFSLWNFKEKTKREIKNNNPAEKKKKLIWGILVIITTLLVIFFRFYKTASIPAEPFSDHAEKILDIYDITQGNTRIFFPRNTGREAFQMYWTLLIAKVFGTGLTFLSLKLGTALLGFFTLPFVYLLGKEIANKRVGLLAFFFMGVSYWHNVISRVGLRFPLYPLFVAPVLFYLLRGIRKQNRNDFILAGLFLGIGAHGYSPFRIMPFVVLAAIFLYFLHKESKGLKKQILIHLSILVLISLIVFLPLGRYAIEHPNHFSDRAFSRIGYFESDSLKIFADNLWDGFLMLNWDNGNIWVHAVTNRPALDIVSGAFFLMGMLLLIFRYLKKRDWRDLYLILAVFLLELPSTLSIAYPLENPALNRAGGAAVVVFVIVALAFDGLYTSLKPRASRRSGRLAVATVAALLLILSAQQNYDLTFNKYATQFKNTAWNSSEMGDVILEFEERYEDTDSVWIVPYKHWVDTRLPGIWAGIPNRDFAMWQHDLEKSLAYPSPKLFIFKDDDIETLEILKKLYPDGIVTRYDSEIPHKDFMLYGVQ